MTTMTMTTTTPQDLVPAQPAAALPPAAPEWTDTMLEVLGGAVIGMRGLTYLSAEQLDHVLVAVAAEARRVHRAATSR